MENIASPYLNSEFWSINDIQIGINLYLYHTDISNGGWDRE